MARSPKSGGGPRVLVAGEFVGHPLDPPEGLRQLHHHRIRRGRRAGCAPRWKPAAWQVDYQPAHVAARELSGDGRARSPPIACVILSDIGANTLLLHPDTFVRSKSAAESPRRDPRLRRAAAAASSWSAATCPSRASTAKARYQGTPVDDALPVEIDGHDDRVEVPEGVEPQVVDREPPDRAGDQRASGRPCSATTASQPKPDADLVVCRRQRSAAWSPARSARVGRSPSPRIADRIGRRRLRLVAGLRDALARIARWAAGRS